MVFSHSWQLADNLRLTSVTKLTDSPKYTEKVGEKIMNSSRYTIRNLDPELMLEARLLAVANRQTLGEIISEALAYYLVEDEEDDDDDMADEDAVAA
jgi:hypothetical protein